MAIQYAQDFADAVGSAANQVVTLSVVVPAGKCLFLMGISASYNTAAAVGLLTVTVGGVSKLRRLVLPAWDIDFKNPIPLAAGSNVVFSLAAVTGAIGSISAWGKITDPIPTPGA